ncbi:MAG: RNA polymerase Rpb4 family protein [Candidatus Marsarchaeota archaeon]|nr:RNA polymerase Rpb4 family protein [Candidatus Marsarchaeota archaeon]
MQSDNEKHYKITSIPEALEILEARKKEGELGYEQQLSYDHAKKFAQLSPEKAGKMRAELEGIGLSAKASVSIIDTMPSDIMQLKQILANEKNTIDDATAAKVFAVVEKNRGK